MKWGLIAALVIAAAISVFNIFLLQMEYLMRSVPSSVSSATSGAIGAILVVTIGALVLVWRKHSNWWVFFATMIILVAGMAPRVLEAVEKQEAREIREEGDRRVELVMTRDIELRKRDVEERIAAQRPYTPAEAMAFVEFVQDSDLSYRSLSDHSDVAFALLQRALENKILDPNGMVKGVRPVDINPEPLFLHYYRATARPLSRGPVRIRDWKLLQLLVANGADLSVEGTERLVEDLRKTPKPIANVPKYVELD